jgi:hypothetical protein
MKNIISKLATLAFVAVIGSAFAAGTATHTATFTIPAVDEIALSGTAPTITLATPVAGAVIASGDHNLARLAFSSNNEALRNIEVKLNSAMPAGTQLTLVASGGTRTTDNLAFAGGVAPTWTSAVTLSALGAKLVNAVTGFQEVAYTDVVLTYALTASLDAAPVAGDTRIVTFTIIAN